MLYLDYTWDLYPQGIILDPELDPKKLEWRDGDKFIFRVAENGRGRFEKIMIREHMQEAHKNATSS